MLPVLARTRPCGARAAQPALQRAVDAEDRQRRLERGGVARILRHAAQHRDQGIGGEVVVARQAGPVGDDHVLDRHAPGRQRPLVGAAGGRQRIDVGHVGRQADPRPQRLGDQVLAHLHQPDPDLAQRRRFVEVQQAARPGGLLGDVVDVRDVAAHADAESAQRVAEREEHAARRVVGGDGAHVVAAGARHAAGHLERAAERPPPREHGRRRIGAGGRHLAGEHEVGGRRLEPHRRRRVGPRAGGDHHLRRALVELQRADGRGIAEGQVVPGPAGAERLVGQQVVVADQPAVDARHAEHGQPARPTRRAHAACPRARRWSDRRRR